MSRHDVIATRTGEVLLKDILQWDVKSWSVALHFWNRHVDFSRARRALEIGSRSGGLTLWTAANGVDTVCSDYVDAAAEPAAALLKSYGLSDRFSFAVVDAVSIPYENTFDIILFKSVLGGIGANDRADRQAEALKQMHKALKPGGILLFAENLSASLLHRFFRRRCVGWGSSWRYPTLIELQRFLAPFAHHEIKTAGFSAPFGRNEKQREVLASLDRAADPVLPSSVKCIACGYARKSG